MLDKVSVIIPAFNAHNSIKQCLDSVLLQTYTNLEIIIINDGSTDSTLDVIAEYSDARIKIINQSNKGVSAARNVGLEKVSGDFVVFIDSDDIVDCNYIQRQHAAMQKYNADLTVCGYYHLDENDNIIGTFPNSHDRIHIGRETYISHEDMWLGLITHESIGSALWNKMFKMSLIGALRFDENLAIGEDLIFLSLYINKCNAIYFLPDKLYKYIQNPKGAMKSIRNTDRFNTNWESEWTAIKVFESIVDSNNSLGHHFEEALFEKKVTIADKILVNAKDKDFWDDKCSEMYNFLKLSKRKILFNRYINLPWKTKIFLRY